MTDPDLEQKPSRRLWILAAVAALALHLGGAALAVAHLRADEDGLDGLGASGAEFAVEMASPKVPDDELPPGPDADQMQATPEVPEQQAEVKEVDLPKDRPVEAEDPDRIVTLNESKKPKEDDPKVAAVQTQASEETPARKRPSRKTLDENAPEGRQGKSAEHRHRQGQTAAHREMGPEDQRLYQAASALSGEQEQGDQGKGQSCAQPPWQRRIRQCRGVVGRCGV